MAITVAGGLAFSTFFTLLAVPLFYTLFDDLGSILARLSPWVAASRTRRARTLVEAAPPAPAAAEGVPLDRQADV
jgi:hypothetical protein